MITLSKGSLLQVSTLEMIVCFKCSGYILFHMVLSGSVWTMEWSLQWTEVLGCHIGVEWIIPLGMWLLPMG